MKFNFCMSIGPIIDDVGLFCLVNGDVDSIARYNAQAAICGKE